MQDVSSNSLCAPRIFMMIPRSSSHAPIDGCAEGIDRYVYNAMHSTCLPTRTQAYAVGGVAGNAAT